MTLTFKIFGRFAEATNVRPIPIRLEIAPDPETEDARALELFQLYGKPMTVSASISLDLPGGLGGDFDVGTARVGPTADMPDGRLRFRLVDPAGIVLAILPVAAGPTSMAPDGRGTYRQVIDASGMVEIEVLTRLDDLSTTLNASFSTQAGGLTVYEALAAIEFIDAWQAGNRLQLSAEHGRFLDFFVLSDEVRHQVTPGLIKVLRAMNTIQDFATGPLMVPVSLSRDEANEIVNAARLIAGETLLVRWNEVVLDCRAAAGHLHQEFDAELRANWEVAIGDQVVFVGVSTTHMDAARVVQAERPEVSDSGEDSEIADRLVPGRVSSARISLDTTAEPLAGNCVEILTATARPLGGGGQRRAAPGE